MLKLLLPMMMMLAGIGAGLGAGMMLRPDAVALPADGAAPAGEATPADEAAADGAAAELPPAGVSGVAGGADQASAATDDVREYVAMNNQFVVPVVNRSKVVALVVLSIGLELRPGATELVYRQQPKLRDALLQVLFDHANMGGFDGEFTDSAMMNALRRALKDATHRVVGDVVTGILITEIARQDS